MKIIFTGKLPNLYFQKSLGIFACKEYYGIDFNYSSSSTTKTIYFDTESDLTKAIKVLAKNFILDRFTVAFGEPKFFAIKIKAYEAPIIPTTELEFNNELYIA